MNTLVTIHSENGKLLCHNCWNEFVFNHVQQLTKFCSHICVEEYLK